MARRRRAFRRQAAHLRCVSGSAGLEVALQAAVAVLGGAGIAHLVCGGYAVQEHGYARFTSDLDLIVPDVAMSAELLDGRGFHVLGPASMRHVATAVELDLFEGCSVPGKGPVPFPLPSVVSLKPELVSLADLVSLKLSGYAEQPLHRVRHYADAVELVMRNGAWRRLDVHAGVRDLYEAIRRGLLADHSSDRLRSHGVKAVTT